MQTFGSRTINDFNFRHFTSLVVVRVDVLTLARRD